MDQCFHVQFVRPDGWSYEMWPHAAGEVEAVATADALLEYLERIGISDYLEPDGTGVRGDAVLQVSRVDEPPRTTLQLRITRPDGTLVER